MKIKYLLPIGLAFVAFAIMVLGLIDRGEKGTTQVALKSPLIGKVLPDFETSRLYDATLINQDDLLGQPYLLNIWATWCPTCKAEHAFLNQLSAQGVRIVGLNYKDVTPQAIALLKKDGDPYAISLTDPRGQIGLDLGVYGAPETYFVDSKGIIHEKLIGELSLNRWNTTYKAIYEGME
ncbi:DsbE family thiol:disulfide interchange protein [Marinicellulosiphila megalodicopiae]|uniref:DsbE family thiol:disulfide interchange protein n=1 Tax=Marinicellulosiphila megalodicopiae TaxID=2724896 RepID=UPI003BAE7013